MFHLDALGNTEGKIGIEDDFIITSDNKGGVIVSLSQKPYLGASLSLNDPNKALRLNRVQLNSPNGEDPLNPVQDPINGMLVYNTATAGTYPDNVSPGPYVYKDNTWQQLPYVLDNTDMGKYSLVLDNTPISKLTTTAFNLANFFSNATTLKLKKDGDSNADTTQFFTLSSFAAYGITIDFNGSTTNTLARWGLGNFYVAAVDVTDENNPVVLDIVQITPAIGTGTSKTSYSTILGFNGDVGTKISIMIGQSSDATKTWTLTAPSSVLIWRL